MTRRGTTFDIETISQDRETLKKQAPPFDPEAVKLGNLKDPEKIKIKMEFAEIEQWEQFVRDAALNAYSGIVKLCGFKDAGSETIRVLVNEADTAIQDRIAEAAKKSNGEFAAYIYGTESHLLAGATSMIADTLEGGFLVSYFGNYFDLPFLARRAAILGNPEIMRILRRHRRGKYLDGSKFVDLHDEWTMAEKDARVGGLDGLSQKLGVPGGKLGDGAGFGKWYDKNPIEGVQYLLNDVIQTEGCALKMGVV